MATATANPPVPAPFRWHGDHIAVPLTRTAGALFATRRGGVSKAPFDSLNLGRWTEDDVDAVAENRARLAETVGIALDEFAQGRQVHGRTILRITDRPADTAPDADGVATARDGVALHVLTADCLPVAIATPTAVAMVHAGWRGLAEGVLEEGVKAVRDLGEDDGPLVAAIGPGAGGCCYEVGDEVREQLGVEPIGAPAPIDLKAIAAERLRDAGAEAVHDTGLCTMCTDPALFFSHRRDGPVTGRQGGVAWRLSS